jgi:hypothetical protein
MLNLILGFQNSNILLYDIWLDYSNIVHTTMMSWSFQNNIKFYVRTTICYLCVGMFVEDSALVESSDLHALVTVFICV